MKITKNQKPKKKFKQIYNKVFRCLTVHLDVIYIYKLIIRIEYNKNKNLLNLLYRNQIVMSMVSLYFTMTIAYNQKQTTIKIRHFPGQRTDLRLFNFDRRALLL